MKYHVVFTSWGRAFGSRFFPEKKIGKKSSDNASIPHAKKYKMKNLRVFVP
jgi:hypothetical protein